MRDAMDSTDDRAAALARFLGSIPPTERRPLRALLHLLKRAVPPSQEPPQP